MTYTAGSITGDATQAADVYLRGGANGILGSFGGDVYIDGGVGITAGNVFIGANSGQVNIEASDLLAKQGQFLYIKSKHSGGTVTNATFTYDADASGSVKQIFFGTTEFGNNGEVPVVDFTGATVTGLTADVARNIESDNDVNITVNSEDSSSYTWNFGNTGDLTIPGRLILSSGGVQEAFQPKVDATGVVDHDCALGQIFYHTSPDANWTANFTNINLASSTSTNLVLVIEQGATPYYPSAVQIGGVAQTIKWLGNVTPTPSANKTEIATFTIFNNASGYNVLGSYSTYG
jgi:hypothetical protein